MCVTCGCGDPELVPVELHERILAGNDRTAAHNREHFREAGVLALNLMGSPGSGKTAVLEATARLLRGVRLGAVSADLATDNDARRLEKAGIPSKAITTGQACHLDADLVHRALHGFPWQETEVFFIENVGNLVCPAIYDLGQEANVVVLSVTEGEDKPLKYPVMFRKADLVLVTKADLVPHLEVDVGRIGDALSRVMPEPRMLLVSARTGAGMGEWAAWVEGRRAALGRPSARAAGHPHAHRHPHEHGGGEPGHGRRAGSHDHAGETSRGAARRGTRKRRAAGRPAKQARRRAAPRGIRKPRRRR
ncbi:MAG TPA: hydrogenase nickel incorporation protein HypB [Anaeromyxobacteraceae bacterium]